MNILKKTFLCNYGMHLQYVTLRYLFNFALVYVLAVSLVSKKLIDFKF